VPRERRLEGFLIKPAVVLNDPAFLVMSELAQRAYLIMLLRLWDAKEPGVAPDDDRALSFLAGLPLESRKDLRHEVEPAFVISGGKWRSQVMVATYLAQKKYVEDRRRGGRATQTQRKLSTSSAQAEHKLSSKDVDVDVDVDVDSEKTLKPTPSSPTDVGGWPGQFERFWESYPKKVGKKAAFRTWMRLTPHERNLDLFLATIRRQRQSDQWQRDGGQYIPNPSVWLNQGRWDDEPQANNNGPAERVVAREPDPAYMSSRERDPNTSQHVASIIAGLAKSKEMPE
jgi:uncharacterized protein YdaU (DUF1376 family)